MRILVCGARDYIDKDKIWRVLDRYRFRFPIKLVIIEGEARGADTFAREWAEKNLSPNNLEKFPADWKKYGRAAGAIRNREMLEQGKPDLVLAFGGRYGKGTNNMVNLANKAGIPVQEFDRDA